MNSGKPRKQSMVRQELGARDRRIIDDLIRFRLLTNEAIQRLHLPESKVNAATKVTARLVKTKWLKSHEYAGNRQYFVAGRKTIRCFGLPTSRGRTLGPQSLAMHLAILEFVATTLPRQRVLTDQELRSLIPTATKEQRAMTHSLETMSTKAVTADVVWRLIRVDLGGSPTHVAKKLSDDILLRVKHEHYAGLLARKKLVLVALTATTAKKSRLEAAIRSKAWPTGTRFQVSVTPVLAQLFGGI